MTTTASAPDALTEESDPFCLAPGRAAQLLSRAPWCRFAAVGDSLAAGTGDPSPGYASLGWPDRFADVLRRVRPRLEYLNTAEVGATSGRTFARQMDRLDAFGPDLVHVACGANDLFRRDFDIAAVERSVRRVHERAAATGAQLTTFTLGRAFQVPAIPDWGDRIHALNALVRDVARAHDAVLVDMWDHPVNARPGLVSADRIHFAAVGQAVLAAELVRALAERLAGRDLP